MHLKSHQNFNFYAFKIILSNSSQTPNYFDKIEKLKILDKKNRWWNHVCLIFKIKELDLPKKIKRLKSNIM